MPCSSSCTVYFHVDAETYAMQDKIAISTLKKILKNSKLSKDPDFLNNSPELLLRAMLTKEFPWRKRKG